jgi:branched-chain amino acid transport system ATP-binding protein
VSILLSVQDLGHAFGARPLFDGVSFTLAEGDRVGLIGPNGAGKSTFFNCLTGDLPVTSGTVAFNGTDVTRLPPEARARLGLARSFQVPLTFDSMSVLDNATIGALLRHPNARDARAKARAVLERVGLGPLADSPAKSLGTPGRKRLEIARALASEPKALLLDEAMAGLTPTEVREAIELVRRIHGDGITIVIVEHIMEVIVSLARKVVVFHQGREISRGTPREVTSDPRVIEAYLGRRKVRHAEGT